MREDKSEYALEIQDLTVEYRTRGQTVYAVNGLNLKVRHRQTLGFVGETGAGKTTTGLSILNLLPQPAGHITHGNIFLHGKNVLEMSETQLQEMRGKEVSMIFQDPMTSLNPVLRVNLQIAEVIEKHEHISSERAFQRSASHGSAVMSIHTSFPEECVNGWSLPWRSPVTLNSLSQMNLQQHWTLPFRLRSWS